MKRMTAAEALKHPWLEHQLGSHLPVAAVTQAAAELRISSLTEPLHAVPETATQAETMTHTQKHRRPSKKKRINGDQLANRLENFVGMSKLKKVALNVLAHHLTEKEIAELSLIWKQVDVDNSGTITISQLRDVLVQNGHSTTEDEMRHFLEGMDTDHNKVIDYHEFAAALLARNQTIRDVRSLPMFYRDSLYLGSHPRDLRTARQPSPWIHRGG